MQPGKIRLISVQVEEVEVRTANCSKGSKDGNCCQIMPDQGIKARQALTKSGSRLVVTGRMPVMFSRKRGTEGMRVAPPTSRILVTGALRLGLISAGMSSGSTPLLLR